MYIPVILGIIVIFVVDVVICGSGIVSNTPALVPIHRRSLQASNDVTRKHAALCCRIMSSQPVTDIQHNINTGSCKMEL